MFTSAVEEIFRRMNTEAGINISRKKLNNLLFADDIILYCESEEQLKNELDTLNSEGKKDGIMYNDTARTKQRRGL